MRADKGLILCRECGALFKNTAHCPDCKGGRQLRHPELDSLSIAHVDCDAFFAAIEKRDNPDLAHHPVIVGGGRRGVVSTCCYIARAFGVRSAMPMFKAKERCPHAVVVPPQFEKYVEAARIIREEMNALTPMVQPLSIDEAFLDLSGTERLHGATPASTLARLAQRIEDRVGITVSVGLSHNKLLAKIASDLDKPRGFAVIGREETLAFLAPRPTTTLFGVGDVFATRLARQGFQTLGDIQQASLNQLIDLFGETGFRLHRLARGEDDRPVRTARESKSISGETTFFEDITDRNALEDKLYAMTQRVSTRAKKQDLAGRVVTLKLKTSQFRSLTRQQALPYHTNLAGEVFETARTLLLTEIPRPRADTAYRLLGVGLSDFSPADQMATDYLFTDDHHRLRAKEGALAALRDKFGQGAIGTYRDQRLTPHVRKD